LRRDRCQYATWRILAHTAIGVLCRPQQCACQTILKEAALKINPCRKHWQFKKSVLGIQRFLPAPAASTAQTARHHWLDNVKEILMKTSERLYAFDRRDVICTRRYRTQRATSLYHSSGNTRAIRNPLSYPLPSGNI
jgi:hypothetical protein